MSEDNNSAETEETERTTSVNRRRFMKTVGTAGSMMGFGAVGIDSVGASQASNLKASNITSEEKDRLKSAKQPYKTPQTAENAIRTHGGQLLDKLKQQGTITSASALHTDAFVSAKQYENGKDGMGITSYRFNGALTAHIHTSMETPDGYLTIAVEPQIKRSYAILKESVDDPDSIRIIDSSDYNSVDDSMGTMRPPCYSFDRSGEVCIWDDIDGDPTPADNCWIGAEVYELYCGNGSGPCCYLGDFYSCAGLYDPCFTGISCSKFGC